jgi:hypothetical protein
VIGLTLTLLSGRMTQPEQDWLPISIPQTYFIESSSEEADGIVLIGHLFFCALTIPVFSIRCDLSPGSASEKPDLSGRVSAHIGSAILPKRLPVKKPLAVATSRRKTLETLMDGEPSRSRGSLFT